MAKIASFFRGLLFAAAIVGFCGLVAWLAIQATDAGLGPVKTEFPSLGR